TCNATIRRRRAGRVAVPGGRWCLPSVMLVARVNSSATSNERRRRVAPAEGTSMKISVIGLGMHGTPLAAVLASKGHYVVGVDVNPDFVRLLADGKSPVDEPGIQKLVREHRSRLSATGDIEAAILATEVSFIIVPTPTDSQGGFSNKYVLSAITAIGQA